MVAITSTFLALIPLISSLASATPIAARDAPGVTATLIGAADAQYSVYMPVNSAFTPTNNALSISHISVSGGGPCVFFGVDGAVVFLPAEGGFVDVGPPQTITGGICGTLPSY